MSLIIKYSLQLKKGSTSKLCIILFSCYFFFSINYQDQGNMDLFPFFQHHALTGQLMAEKTGT